MKRVGLEWQVWDTPAQFEEVASITTPPSGIVRVAAKDKAGTSALYLKDDAGSEREIAPNNAVTGTGATGRVAFWTSASVIGSDSLFFWDDTNNRLGIGTGTPGISLGTGRNFLTILGSTHDGVLELGTNQADADGNFLGIVQWVDKNSTLANLTRARIVGVLDGTTANQRGGNLRFYTSIDAVGTILERFRIGASGQWGIGGATFGTANQAFLSGGASAAPTWTSLDHGAHLGGLTDDDHTVYALLLGRSGGQTLIGGTGSGDDLTLQSTSNATRGDLITDCADITMVAASKVRMASQNRFRHLNSMALAAKANQSLNDVTWTLITWTAADTFDTDSMHDPASNDSRILAPIAGKYLAMATVGFAANTTGSRFARIEKNAAGVLDAGTFVSQAALDANTEATNPTATSFSFFGLVDMAANDYIEVFAYQSSGGALNVLATRSNFALMYVGE